MGVTALPAVNLGEGFSIGGDVMTGFEIGTTDGDTTMRAWNDSDDFAARINLTARYVTALGGAASQYRMNSNDDSQPAGMINGSPAMSFGFGWFNLFNNKATVYAGKIGTPIWRDTGEIIDKHTDAVQGARLEIKPIEGLSFGVALPFGAEQELSNVLRDIVFGVGYTSEAFTIKTAIDLVPASSNGKSAAAIAGGAEIPVSKLTVYLDWLYRTEAINYDGNNAAGGTGKAAAGNGAHHIWGEKGLDIGTKLAMELSETLGASAMVRAGLAGEDTGDVWNEYAENPGDNTLALELQADFQVSEPVGVYVMLGSDNLAWFEGIGLKAKVGATFAIAENISVELYDQVGSIGANPDFAKITNTVQLNFGWSF
jgi:hypothetical protein